MVVSPGEEYSPEIVAAESRKMDSLLRESSALPADAVVGAILRFPRGDGYAFYKVVSERPLTLQWIQYGDCWQVESWEIRGLRLTDIRLMIDRRRKLPKVLG